MGGYRCEAEFLRCDKRVLGPTSHELESFTTSHFEAADGEEFEPVELTRRMFEGRSKFPDVRDVVLLRVLVIGSHEGQPRALQYDVFDSHDETTGFSAMERTTAFPAALVGHFQARGLIEPGARPLELCVLPQRYLDERAQQGIAVVQSRV